MVLEAYKKEQEANDSAKKPAEPAGKNVKEILQDKESSSLLGSMLERDGDKDLAQRLSKGNLSEGDLSFLDTKRQQFNKTMEEASGLEGMLSKDTILELANSAPAGQEDLKKIINLVGPEEAAKIMKDRMKNLAITDPDRFGSMSHNLKMLESYKNGSYKQLNEKVKGVVEKRKVDETEYAKALMIENEDERKKALKQAVTKNYGFLKKSVNWLTGGTFSKPAVAELAGQKGEIDAAVKGLKERQWYLGSSLAVTYDQNPDVRKALSETIIGDTPKKKNEMGFGQLKSVRNNATVENIDGVWSAYRGDDFEALGAAEKESKKNEFINAFIKQSLEGMPQAGTWFKIIKTMVERILQMQKPRLA